MYVDSNVIMQVSIVVRDIEKTARNIAEMFNVEKPEMFYLSKFGDTYAEYYGVPTDTKMKLLVFRFGSVDFELIEPDDKPSTFKKFLDEHGEGVHNIGVVVKDKEKALGYMKSKGIETRHWGSFPGGTYYHMDTEALIGVILNIKHEE